MNLHQHKVYAELAVWSMGIAVLLLLQPPQTTFAYISFGYFALLGLWGLKSQAGNFTSAFHKAIGTGTYLLAAPLLAPFIIGANLTTFMTLSIGMALTTFFCVVVAAIYADKIALYEKARADKPTPKNMGDSILHD